MMNKPCPFCGGEPFFMDKITDLLIENVLSESERDFNQMIMYGVETPGSDIKEIAENQWNRRVKHR